MSDIPADIQKIADEVVRDSSMAALTMPTTPESAQRRSLAWSAAVLAVMKDRARS